MNEAPFYRANDFETVSIYSRHEHNVKSMKCVKGVAINTTYSFYFGEKMVIS